MGFRIAGYTAGILALLLLLVLFVSALTGKTPRAYSVLDPGTRITIHGETLTCEEMAQRYQPVMKRISTFPTPPLLEVRYEVIDQPDAYAINYYHVWEDEIHPNPLIHALYRLFRAAYYGYPVRDVEYIQVNVSKKDAEVIKIRFETSPGEDYFVVASVHLVDQYFWRSQGLYDRLLSSRSGTEISRTENVPFLFTDHHPIVGIATWNHLTRRILSSDTAYDQVLNAKLIPLDAVTYKEDKYVRKSQGDFQTHENPFWRFIGMGAMVLYFIFSGLGLITMIAKQSRRLKKEER